MLRTRKSIFLLTLFLALVSACRPGETLFPAPAEIASAIPRIAALQDTPTPLPTATPAPTETPSPTPTPDYPPQGYGPSNFPPEVNPLTGLKAINPALLERRPVIIKVSNLPRYVRPQWGLTLADIIYEYYTEEGSTRYTAVFYGADAEQVGDIRSARFFDEHLINMYKGIFAFGSADYRVRYRLYNSNFANRLILEWNAGCPAMCRYDPKNFNFLLGNTRELSAYATKKGIPNGRQNLDGMFFQKVVPAGGAPAEHIYVRFSAAIYNRWDYDALRGEYLRFSDKENDQSGQGEVYEQLTDRLTGQSVAADNVVILFVPHQYYSRKPEMVEMNFSGSGPAYAFRDGQVYPVTWQRPAAESVVYLTYEDGRPFPFKPGATFFEVVGKSSTVEQTELGWRFLFLIP